jgi:acetyl-CoA synthetase
MLIQEDLGLAGQAARTDRRRRAAEPRGHRAGARAWGLTIRDGFGQTETTAQIGNPPGQPVKPGSMGRPLPGYRGGAARPDDKPADEGEICIDLAPRPTGLMTGYAGDADKTPT